MALQAVTLYLPSAFYQKITQRARQEQRSVEDELVAVVTAALPDLNDLPDNAVVQVQVTPALPIHADSCSLFGAFPELAALTDSDFDWAKRAWEHSAEKQITASGLAPAVW